MRHRVRGFRSTLAFVEICTAGKSRILLLSAIAALALATPHFANAQNTDLPADSSDADPIENAHPPVSKPPAASEITVEGLVSYGNYTIFASGENCKMYDVGIEYDRHSWGRLLGSNVYYVAEVLPMVLLNQPTKMDIWGDSLSQTRKTVPGVAILPVGVRWVWRDGRAIKPYLMAKGGALVFAQKALSSKATYENLSLQSAVGLEIKLNDRYDLRLGLFGDFHFSDGFIVPVNPGLDVMNATMGITYHLDGHRRIKVR